MSRFDLILSGITAAALLALYVLLRYRVHVHVTYSRGSHDNATRRNRTVRASLRAGQGQGAHGVYQRVAPGDEPVCERGGAMRGASRRGASRLQDSGLQQDSLSSAQGGPKSGPVVVSSAAPAREQETTPILDIVSALSNLNVPVKRARAIALQVQAETPGASFDELIRKAVQKAREAA